MEEKKKDTLNTKRRNLIKLGVFGAGAFAVAKVFGDFLPRLPGVDGSDPNDFNINDFNISQDKNEMKLTDPEGNPIIIVDKASFRK